MRVQRKRLFSQHQRSRIQIFKDLEFFIIDHKNKLEKDIPFDAKSLENQSKKELS